MAQDNARRLMEKFGVTQDQAEGALALTQGDLLDAAELLERERPAQERQVGQYSTAVSTPSAPRETTPSAPRLADTVGRALKGALTRPSENCLEVSHPSGGVLDVPVLIFLLLLCVAFWLTLGLVLLGWVVGCRFALRGPDVALPQVNRAMDAVCDKMARWRKRGARRTR